MLGSDRRELSRAGVDRMTDKRLGIIDDKESATSSALDRSRVETPVSRRRGCNPESRTTYRKLSDDVVPLAHEVKRGRVERGLVEIHSLTRPINP
jgi:hypothetical protein